MNTVNDTYAVFQANQVLTEAHLNEMFNYLDEQGRLTRANLIGIGIDCGLDVVLDGTTVRLSKGCGVTSQGYLIVEPAPVTLLAWRTYTVPDQLPYPMLRDTGVPLWELLPALESDAKPLSEGGLTLDDKAMLLFLELRQEGLRTCAPNDCDDRGSAVTATVRRLLIQTTDLAKVVAAVDKRDPGSEAGVLARLRLPDLRMPRVDVPNSGPVGSADVLAAFQRAFRESTLVARTAAALSDAYGVFQPLLAPAFTTNPFGGLASRFDFLDTFPKTTGQVRFLQYYWELFDDLIRAYDDFRWAGTDLLSVCCPPDRLFPRHLMLGVLKPASVAEPAVFRHRWLPSPATGRCADQARDLLTLFRRLVAMLERFTDQPPLPSRGRGRFDPQIRVTPSVWGPGPLAATAIPYYYRSGGPTPLHQVWDPGKTRRRRGDRNLGYRVDEYETPIQDFVLHPLRFGLEPYNFLRVEGHLGKALGTTMATLLNMRATYRLPIEVVALRTGVFDENAPIDLTVAGCRFDDLEAIYATLKAELTCFLCKETQYFYGLPFAGLAAGPPSGKSNLPLLRVCAPGFRVQPETIGRLVEDMIARRGFLTVADGKADQNAEFAFQTFRLVIAMSSLFGELTADVRHLDTGRFGDRYGDLVEAATGFENARLAAMRIGAGPLYSSAGLESRLADIVLRCRLEPFRALQAEYQRRFREAQQAQYLSTFLERHPGIQHRSGAPIGGTFILVYHESPAAAPAPQLAGRTEDDVALAAALGRLRFDATLSGNADLQEVYQLLTGNVLVGRQPPATIGERIYVDAEAELADGTIIADFFLPYSLHSDCPPIQFTLPADRPRLDLARGCTNADGNAEVTLAVTGGTGAFSVRVDDGPFTESNGTVLLAAGAHTVVIRDSTGTESAPVPIVVPPALVIGPATITEDTRAGTYQVSFTISGGTPGYTVAPGRVVGTTYAGDPIHSGDATTVTVTDAAGCTTTQTFEHTVENICDLPCDGEAIRAGHRFWIPEATVGFPINKYSATEINFQVVDPQGNRIDLSDQVAAVVGPLVKTLPSNRFATVVTEWLAEINRIVADKVQSPDWLRLDYAPPAEGFTTGTLLVERLVCVDLAFKLKVTFTQARATQTINLRYVASQGTAIEPEKSGRAFPPAFDPVTLNKCRPGEDPVEVCGDLDLTMDFTVEFVDGWTQLTAVQSGNDKAVMFVWEVQDGIPAIISGFQAMISFDPVEPREKVVRLTGYTEKGCSASVVRSILVGG